MSEIAVRTGRQLLAGLGVALLLVGSARAQGGGQQDLGKVEIKTTKVAGGVYVLEGQGGAIGVLPGPDGVLMVDSQFAPLTPKIVGAIRQLTDKPIKFLINTHVHGDHTGGNENLGKMGVTIIAREPLRMRLMKPNPAANGTPGVPAPAVALPTLTYEGSMTFHMNGEDVQTIAVPVAHTDGDTMVLFKNADVLMTGDFYRSLGYPNIDRANGGSLKGMLEGLGTVVRLAGPSTKIVPGHGEIVDRNAVAAHRDMIVAIRDKVARLVQQGQTAEQVVASKPTADFDAKVTGATAMTADRFVNQLYAELKAAGPTR
jgi:glyoxylase-like metal-dependent hydrolase (beta-lactamase superfamily II)